MTTITRTSPLDLIKLRKTQRRVAALLNRQDNAIEFSRRKRFPPGFCYVCSELYAQGRGRGEGGRTRNPYRHLFANGRLRPCPHLPPAPYPTFVGDDDDDDDDGGGSYDDEDDYDDDGFDEESLEFVGEVGEGGLFDTSIVRDDSQADPRLFSLPPVFGGAQADQKKRSKRKTRKGRLVPVVSEKTFLSTNHRAGADLDPAAELDLDVKVKVKSGRQGDDLRLPRLSGDQRVSLVAEGQGRVKVKDPRRLHSERIDRRVAGPLGDEAARSDSAIGLDMARSNTGFSREKTDPPPQPIVVSIRNQDGDVVQKIPLENLPPGQIPTEAFVDEKDERRRQRRREKKRRRSGHRTDSASPSFSGSISFSRETTLSDGFDSPDMFMARLRSASWCECPDHSANESRCGECRKVIGHEKWCVSRNTVCQTCGKAFKRKYAHLERKSSFSTIQASSFNNNNNGEDDDDEEEGADGSRASRPRRGSRNRNCSPSKVGSFASASASDQAGGQREITASGRVRFRNEDGEVVYPERADGGSGAAAAAGGVADSGVDTDREAEVREGGGGKTEGGGESTTKVQAAAKQRGIAADVHKKAYLMALADARLNPVKVKAKSKAKDASSQGLYFSYFPLLRRSDPQGQGGGSELGVRADAREGKQLGVAKGLKHILGNAKLENYYPGGKRYRAMQGRY